MKTLADRYLPAGQLDVAWNGRDESGLAVAPGTYFCRLESGTYRATTKPWITEDAMDWRHVYDGHNWASALAKSLYVMSIPSPYLIGKRGELVVMGSDCRGERLEEHIQEALKARRPIRGDRGGR